jgi:hypothetical protein
VNERSITSTTGGNDQPGELESRLREKAKTDRQINNFLRLITTITEAKALPIETIDQTITFLREQNILEIGPGNTTDILDFLINELCFDQGKLYAIDRLLKDDPTNAQVASGRYKRGKIETSYGAWPRFGIIFGFHVLSDLLIVPTKSLADQLYNMIAPKGLLAISSVNHSNSEPIKCRFGQPIAAYHPEGLLLFSKGQEQESQTEQEI